MTGAASGIGRETAFKCASEGAAVLLMDLNERVGDVAGELAAAGHECLATVGDVSVEADCARAIDGAIAQWGRLDGGANCAGGASRGPVATTTIADWEAAVALNLRGAFLVSREAVRAIRMGGQGGSLVHVASTAALVGMPNLAGYSAAKGGVVALVRELAVELSSEGIRANAVCPGATDTPAFWGRSDVRADPTIAQRVIDDFPLLRFHHRLIHPSEIADAIVFLLSDESRMITGTALPVDAGYVAR